MLDYSIIEPQGILLLKPQAPLSAADFGGLSAVVDAYLAEHAKLQGVLIHTKGFPGWESFGGFTAHMHFVREHHRQVKRLAIVTDSPIAGVAGALARHFTSAEVRHFPFLDAAPALEWLEAA